MHNIYNSHNAENLSEVLCRNILAYLLCRNILAMMYRLITKMEPRLVNWMYIVTLLEPFFSLCSLMIPGDYKKSLPGYLHVVIVTRNSFDHIKKSSIFRCACSVLYLLNFHGCSTVQYNACKSITFIFESFVLKF